MPPSQTRTWELDDSSLTRLLARLDTDPLRSGQRYEELRQTLVKYFDWRRAPAPEDCADEAIDRIARRLAGGEIVDNVKSYAYGVARLVLLECARRPEARQDALDDLVSRRLQAPTAEREPPLLPCLERCLAALPDESRSLILRYYADESREKIETRAAVARELNLSANALRSRAQRVRARLERCTTNCARGESVAADAAETLG